MTDKSRAILFQSVIGRSACWPHSHRTPHATRTQIRMEILWYCLRVVWTLPSAFHTYRFHLLCFALSVLCEWGLHMELVMMMAQCILTLRNSWIRIASWLESTRPNPHRMRDMTHNATRENGTCWCEWGCSTLHASNIKGKTFQFVHASRPASCVDWARQKAPTKGKNCIACQDGIRNKAGFLPVAALDHDEALYLCDRIFIRLNWVSFLCLSRDLVSFVPRRQGRFRKRRPHERKSSELPEGDLG